MDLSSLNWIAVLGATVAAFALGAIWYGPLFGRRWMGFVGLSEADVQGANMGLTYGVTFVLQLIAVVVLALVMGPEATLVTGALTGLGVGAAWVATAMGVNALFSQESIGLYLINAGYHVAYYTLAGAILGAF